MRFSSVTLLSILASITLLSACSKESNTDQNTIENPAYVLDYGTMPKPDQPSDNPLTVEGVKLGRMLFYEKALSGDGTQSCAGCHRQGNAFSDTAKFSTGIAGMQGGRQAMAIFNMLWNKNEFFWDGRAHLLRDQSIMPIQDPLEMNETLENVVTKLSAMNTYTEQFNRAFGSSEINPTTISLALEQFMNSIVSHQSKYDEFLDGKTQLSPSEERGRKLFFAEYNEFFPNESGADCAHCHSGANFDSGRYTNNGLDSSNSFKDAGRFKVTGNPKDQAAFKITSLRNIALTPPYMHDGRFATLEEVVDHYDHDIKGSPSLDPALANTKKTGLMLDATEKADLIAFLKTLTDYALVNDLRYTDPN